jgi:tetratricopeptide (TPR) repeat protein
MPTPLQTVEPVTSSDPQTEGLQAWIDQAEAPKEDITKGINPQTEALQDWINKADLKQANDKLPDPEVNNIAKAAREIDMAQATLNDKLFLESQSEVSTLKRINQIRRSYGEAPLSEIPKALQSKGFIQDLKNRWNANLRNVTVPLLDSKGVQVVESGLSNTSIGLAQAVYQGKAPVAPPEGAGWELLSQGISIVADPLFVATGSAGGVVAKGAAVKVFGKAALGKGVSFAEKALVRGTTLGAAIGGHAVATDPLQQEIAAGEVDLAQTAQAGLQGVATGFTAGFAGAAPVVGTAAEIATFATTGAAFEGRLPDQKDFAHSAMLILGLKTQSAISNRLGNALRKRMENKPLTPEEQAAIDQTPDSVKEQILQDAMKGLMKDFSLNKEALLTPQGAAEFAARHPSQAKQLAKSENVSRKDFVPIKEVVPDAEVNKWSKEDRTKFQALVAEASGKEVIVEIPTEKETQDGITRTQQEAKEIDQGQKVERVEGQVKEVQGERQEVAVTEELPVTGPKLTKVQEIVVGNAQKAATPETPPENVPVVPVNSLVDAKRRGLSPAKKFYNYLIRGGQHEDRVESNRISDREVEAIIRDVKFSVQSFNQAARKTYGILGRIPEGDVAQINLVLKKQASPDTLPETMRDSVEKFRNDIDVLTQRAIDAGVVQGKLAAIFTSNKGAYLNRSYRIFEEPNFYKKKVPAFLRQKATAVFRSEMVKMFGREPTEIEADAYIRSFLYESAQAGGVLDAVAKGKTGTSFLSILKEKNLNIPEEIRALWGERTDPRAQYANSVVKLGGLIASSESLSRTRNEGLGKWLFEQPTGDFIAPIRNHEIDGMYPLTLGKKLFTLPEYEQALEKSLRIRDENPLAHAYYAANAIVKFNKTAGSVMGIMRNFTGNVAIAAATGNSLIWHPFRTTKSLATGALITAADVAPGATQIASKVAGKVAGAVEKVTPKLVRNAPVMRDVFDFLQLTNKQQQAEVVKLIRLGVMHDASRSGELRQILKDAAKHDSAKAYTESAIKRIAKLPIDKMGDAFRAGDDFWHAQGFYSELSKLKKAYRDSDKSIPELEKMAAEKVRALYPTYSKAPFVVQKARKAIFIGDFVTFPAEMIRITFNAPRIIAKELRTPEERGIGADRAFGFLAVGGMITQMGPASRMMTGITLEQEEAMRILGPEWMRNSTLLHLGKQDRLRYRAIDTTFSLPYGSMTTPIHAILRGEETLSLEEGPLREALRPFFNETILAGTIRDIMANKQISRESDAPIYNREAPGHDQAIDIANYAFDKLDPGTFDIARKIYKGIKNEPMKSGRIPDLRTEIIAATTGQRIWTYDVPRDLGFKARDMVDRRKDARKLFYTIAFAKDASDPEEISEAYDKAIDADRSLFGKLQEATNAAKILGMNDDEIREVFSDKRVAIAKADIDSVISGPYDEENLVRDIVWSLRGKDFDPKIPRILSALGVSESEANRLLFDEFRHKGSVPQNKTLALYMSRIRRRMDQGE